MEVALIPLLVIAGAWAVFLLPPLFYSRKDAPLNSTQEFDRWTTRLATVQGPSEFFQRLNRNQVLNRRRRFLLGLAATALATLAVAFWQSSLELLLVHIAVDAVIAWYVAMLVQIRQRRSTSDHVIDLRDEARRFDEPEVRILASN